MRVDAAGAPLSPPAVKWAAASLALQLGIDILLVDADTVFLQDPLQFLYRRAPLSLLHASWTHYWHATPCTR
jgi:hypothetical protein